MELRGKRIVFWRKENREEARVNQVLGVVVA